MRFTKGLAVCSAVLVCVVTSSLAFGEEAMDARVRSLWDRHWRSYAKQCAEFEGGFLVSPSYDRRYPSGAGKTVRQAGAELSKKVRTSGGGLVVTRTVKQPIGEAQAMALPIPRWAVGEYGHLASVRVLEVLGERSVLVDTLYLIDPEQVSEDYRADRETLRRARNLSRADKRLADKQLEKRYEHRNAVLARQKDKRHRAVKLRLEGFRAEGLAEQERWAGPRGKGLEVVIVKEESYGSERRPRQRWVAVALDRVRWGLDEQAFVRLLNERGLDRAGFVDLVLKRMAGRDKKAGRRQVFSVILKGKAAPAKDSQDADEKPDPAGGEASDGAEAAQGASG